MRSRAQCDKDARRHVPIGVRLLIFGSNVPEVMQLRVDFPGSVQICLAAAAGLVVLACGESPASGTSTDGAGTPDSTSSTASRGTGASQTTGGATGTTMTSDGSMGGAGGSMGGAGGSVGGAGGSMGGAGGSMGSGGTPTTTGEADSGGSGGGSQVDCNTGTLTTRLPCQLSETGLFASDMATPGEGVHPYTPQFKLWSDGAEKRRWVWLPPDSKIDTADMNYWSFPVGTKLWKEFTRDGTRVETRLIEKQKSGTWYTVAYLWRDNQMEADAVPDGVMNASGTEHDVPNTDQCWTCHSQQPDKALGFSAIQLSHDAEDPDNSDEYTLERLIAADLLTDPPSGSLEFSAGWSEQDRATFGYMHANCGTCHNPMGSANSTTGLDLQLKVDDLGKSASESSVYLGIVGVDIMKGDVSLDATKRVDPGSLENSAVYQRLITKGQEWSMPPLGTEIVDPAGQQLLEQFIMGLP